MITAYSYIRFSSIKQHDGDSLKRQQKLIDEWGNNNPSIKLIKDSFHDLGVSGYTGKHLTTEEGLGAFKAAVVQKVIPEKSILLVEAIDRLGRQDTTVQAELILSIINAGITIYTLEDGSQYSTKSVKENQSQIYILIGKIAAAHEYSDRLSKRLRSSREATREAVKTRFSKVINHNNPSSIWITKSCPNWMKWLGTGEYEKKREIGHFALDEDRAKVVRCIFDLYISGLGTTAIATKLNKDKVCSFNDKGWHSSYINKILFNRQAIGELTVNQRDSNKSESIENYYPIAIPRQLYASALQRKELEFKEFRTTDPNKPFDIFSNIVKCGICGSKAKTYNKGKKYYVYQCCMSKRGLCAKPSSKMFNKLHIDYHIAYFLTQRLSFFLLSLNNDGYFEKIISSNTARPYSINEEYDEELKLRIELAEDKYNDAKLDKLAHSIISSRREEFRKLNRELRDYQAKIKEEKDNIESEQDFDRSFSALDIFKSIQDWAKWQYSDKSDDTGNKLASLVESDIKRFINRLLLKFKFSINLHIDKVTLHMFDHKILTIEKPKKTVLDTLSYDRDNIPFLKLFHGGKEELEGFYKLTPKIKNQVRTLLITSDILRAMEQVIKK